MSLTRTELIKENKYTNILQITPPTRDFEAFDLENIFTSIHVNFERVVERYSDKLALHGENLQLTYRELNQKANQIAHAVLLNNNLEKPPIMIFSNSPDKTVVSILAVLKTGGFYIVADPDLPENRLKFLFEDTDTKIIIANQESLKFAKHLFKDGCKIVNQDDVTGFSKENPEINANPESISALLYTSGSTGTPKGVIHTHQNIMHTIAHTINLLHLSPSDRVAMAMNLSFGGALRPTFTALLSGATLFTYDVPRRGMAGIVPWLKEHQLTTFKAVSTFFRQFTNLLATDEQFPHVRVVVFGGEQILPLDIELFKRHFPNAAARLGGGTTEALWIAKCYITKDTIIEGDIPFGYPYPDKEVLIWDDDHNPVPDGEVGEMVVRSRFISPGYWQRPELTAEKFLPDPADEKSRYYLTGDLGRRLPDGMLIHLGRKDTMVKIRGLRVELGGIESILLKHPAIREAAVKDHKSESGLHQLVAYMVLEPGEKEIDFHRLRSFLEKDLPSAMVPTRFMYLDEFPLTTSGKLDRNSLPAPDNSRPNFVYPYIAPNGEIEEKLARIWERLLEITPIGIDDNYFDLGGDSLTAVQLFVEIERTFGRKLPLSILINAGSIREQANILEDQDFIANWSPLVPVRTRGTLPPLFCMAGKGGNPLRFRQLANYLDEDQPVYFLQSRGLSGREKPFGKVEMIADEYLAEIQKVQPGGPYRLCGSSFGGLVAYEIAQRLLQQGEKVDLLALLDTAGPGYPKYLPNMTPTRIAFAKSRTYFAKHISSLARADWAGRKAYLRYYWDARVHLFNKVKNNIQDAIKAVAGPKLPKELRAVEAANLKAAKRYMPQALHGRLDLFRAEEQPLGIYEDPTSGWGNVEISELVVHSIPGHHGNILFEPQVSNLAGIMVELLAKEPITA